MRHVALLAVLGPLAVCVAFGAVFNWLVYEDARTARVWVEEPLAKSLLAYERVRRGERVDVVFVGSSRTQNQIDSTLVAEALGTGVFNYGLPGREWEDYPYMVARALVLRPRLVTIAIPYQSLFEEVACSGLPNSVAEARFYVVNGRYRCVLSGGLRRIVQALPMNRFRPFTAQRQLRDEVRERAWLKEIYGYDLAQEPRAVNYVRGSREHLVVTYRNGDGQAFDLIGRGPARAREIAAVPARDPHPQALAHLRQLATMATARGSGVLFVIEPSSNTRRAVLPPDLLATLNAALPPGARLVNLDSPRVLASMWADTVHLDQQGTRVYSQVLARAVRAYLDGVRVAEDALP